jgi:hypothetical protein
VTAGRAQHPNLQFAVRPVIGVELGLVMATIVAAEDQDRAPAKRFPA